MEKINIRTMFFLMTFFNVASKLSMAQWCSKLGSRSYIEDGGKIMNITIMKKICCENYLFNGTNCNPICEPNCDNGECQAPNNCVCNKGYQMNPSKICEPVCTISCGFGKCIRPETCECDNGYKYSRDRKTCEPECLNTCPGNSKCVGPNQCVCNRGYQALNDDADKNLTCEPICTFGCTNGTCVRPELCECFNGFFMNTTSHICQKNICDASCPEHSYCMTNGGECGCVVGYTKSLFNFQSKLHCEERLIHVLKLLALFLTCAAIFAIIIVIIVKVMAKKVSYEPKKLEEKYNKQYK
ncbi:uncharacterized protein LOC142227544 [Haematobia irritans]|uniref:uncharacterized protein LOC142227544 n=1 Tax=Haematobia irritans TaxID=7368 RepID=UPI003F50D25D